MGVIRAAGHEGAGHHPNDKAESRGCHKRSRHTSDDERQDEGRQEANQPQDDWDHEAIIANMI